MPLAIVSCKYCGKSFNREKIDHVRIPHGKVFRYSHIECYNEAKKNGIEKAQGELVNIDVTTPCIYCKKLIDLKKDKYVKIQEDKYAHLTCVQEDAKVEKTDEQLLHQYIIRLFNLDYLTPRIRKQIEIYIKENKFTYHGILCTLKYFYEVKRNSPSDANESIGIVPYVYDDARKYYYALHLTNLQNKDKNIQDYIPKQINISIHPKKREPMRRNKHFSVEEDEFE